MWGCGSQSKVAEKFSRLELSLRLGLGIRRSSRRTSDVGVHFLGNHFRSYIP